MTLQSLAGFGPDHAGPIGCASTAGGADRVYAVDIPAGWQVEVTVTPSGGMNAVVDLVEDSSAACGALAACLASANANAVGGNESLTYSNATSTIVHAFIIVADRVGPMSSEAFILDVKLVPPGDRCDGTQLSLTSTPLAQTFTGANADLNIAGATCANVSTSADRVYALALPANQLATITASAVAGADVVLNLLSGSATNCSQVSCLASADRGGVDAGEVLSFFNAGDAGLTYLAVSARGAATSSGTFTVSAITGPPSGNTCATVTPIISSPVTLTESLPGTTADTPFSVGAGCVDATGPDVVYTVEIPPRTALELSVASNNDTAINVLDEAISCVATPTSCAGSADRYPWTSPPEVVRVENATNAPRRVHVFVATYLPSGGIGPFTATFAFPPFSDGDVCAAPTVLDPLAGPLAQSMAGARADYPQVPGNGCGDADGGADRIYAVEVLSGEYARVAVTNPVGFDAVASAFSLACTTGQFCSSSSNIGPVSDEFINAENFINAPTVMYAMVAAKGAPTSTGTFNISLTHPVDTCDDAPFAYTVRENTSFGQETLRGLRPNLPQTGTGCTSSDGGVDRVYRIELDAGQRLTAELRAGFSASMNLLPGPASSCATAPACLSTGVPNPDGGSSVLLTYVNGPSPLRGHLVVSARNQPVSDAGYALDLSFSTSTLPGDLCGTATVLTSGVQLTNQSTVGFQRNYVSTHVNCQQNVGPERVYAVDVPALGYVDLTVSSTSDVTVNGAVGAPWNCGQWCAFGLNQTTSGNEGGRWRNDAASPRRLFLLVGGANGTSVGNFSITATVH